jgi:hypothetical protein
MPTFGNDDYVNNAFPLDPAATLSGEYACFVGTGHFDLAKNLAQIDQKPTADLQVVDVTQAVQVLMDVRYFNYRIGIQKDANNVTISPNTVSKIYSSYLDASDNFLVKPAPGAMPVLGADGVYNWAASSAELGDVSVSVEDMLANFTDKFQVENTGAFSGIYSRFKSDVLAYFGWSGGFASLFAESSDFVITGAAGDVAVDGSLEKQGMFNLLTTIVPIPGDTSTTYISPITGGLNLSNVTGLLRRAVDTNAFGNRVSNVDITTLTGDDACKRSAHAAVKADGSSVTNFGVGDGFIHGDMIYIPEGLQCTVQLVLSSEADLTPTNNIGATLISRTAAIGSTASATLTATTQLIQHVVKAPLLIRLVDVKATAADSANVAAIGGTSGPAAWSSSPVYVL